MRPRAATEGMTVKLEEVLGAMVGGAGVRSGGGESEK
jgi:hypothetical protein